MLDRANNRSRDATWLDATAAPRPDAGEVADQLERLADMKDTERLAQNLAVFSAGRAIGNTHEAQGIAEKLLAIQKPDPFSRGDVWLRDVLAPGDD